MSDWIEQIDIAGDRYDLKDLQTEALAQQNENNIEDLSTEIEGFSFPLCFNNISVSSSDWVNQGSSPDVVGYPFRASIATNGTTANYSPDVRFSITPAVSGIFAPVATCANNVTYIYASEQPSGNTAINTIICTKVV